MASKKVKKIKLPLNHLARLRELQRNPDRKDRIISFERIRKFHDASLFGASERGVSLPSNYIIEITNSQIITKKKLYPKKGRGR